MYIRPHQTLSLKSNALIFLSNCSRTPESGKRSAGVGHNGYGSLDHRLQRCLLINRMEKEVVLEITVLHSGNSESTTPLCEIALPIILHPKLCPHMPRQTGELLLGTEHLPYRATADP